MHSRPSILAAAGRLAREVESLLLPVACLGCDRVLNGTEEQTACCAECVLRLRAMTPPMCDRCGQPLDRWEREAGHCGFCRAWPSALSWARSAVRLEEGPARALVHAIKYAGWRRSAHAMGRVVARECGAALGRTGVLVPVPLGRTRLRQRGHNQAAELAMVVGERLGIPVVTGALVRGRETRTQTALDPDGRRRNVAGAFSSGGRRLDGLTVALVDDVLTTGATLGAAAEALASSGAASVGAVTFARASPPR